MTPKQALTIVKRLLIGLAVCAGLCIITKHTLWLFVMLGLALAMVYVETEMVRCPHCDHKLKPGSIRFCPHCGKPLEE